jgi:hypothetical protein
MSIQPHQLGRNPVDDLGYFTTCQISTYWACLTKKSTPKSEVRRQRRICESMVESCRNHGLREADLKDLVDSLARAVAADKTPPV